MKGNIIVTTKDNKPIRLYAGEKFIDETHYEINGEVHSIIRSGLLRGNHETKDDAPPTGEVLACIHWIMEFAEPTEAVVKRHTSYGLKHIVERYSGDYVSNGAFIEAALLLGFKCSISHGSINPYFNMTFKKWDVYQKYLFWVHGRPGQTLTRGCYPQWSYGGKDRFLKKYSDMIPWFEGCMEMEGHRYRAYKQRMAAVKQE